jgi:outer membrane protein TolC
LVAKFFAFEMTSRNERTPRPSVALASAVLALPLGTACISQDAGYADMKKTVHDRIGQDVSWHAIDPDTTRARDETRALLAKPLSAEAAVRLAVLNSHDLQAAFEEIGIARSRLVRSVALPNPELEGRIGFISGSRPDLTFTVTESVSDLLWLPLREGAARADLDVAKLRVAGRVLDLVFAVKVAFYERRAAERVLLLTRRTRDAAEASYEAAERLHQAGNIPDLDYLNQQALREESATAAAEAELGLSRAAGRLAVLVGVALPRAVPSETGEKTGSSPSVTALPARELDVGRLDQRALERSLDVAIARGEGDAASKRASLARATSLVPELRAGFEAEREESWALGPVVGLRLPLFYQGQGEVGEAEARMRRAGETRAALLTRVGAEANLAGARLLSARAKVARYENVLLPLRRRIVEETLLGYNAMSVGVFQLLQAKRDQLESELRYVRSVRDYWVIRTEVELLMAGRLPAPGAAEAGPPETEARGARAASHD